MSYNKLVRDNIPDIIRENGEEPIIRILSEEDYKKELIKKIVEECQEVVEASGEERIAELADLLEVMIAIAESEGKTYEDVEAKRVEKKLKRGAFQKKIYLESVKRCK